MQLQTRTLTAVVMVALIGGFGLVRQTTTYAQEAASKLDDPTIVAIFDAANTYDIETGSLAVEKGHSQAVREFGAMLVRDHRNVRAQGRDLAESLRVTPTPPRGEFALA